MNFPAIHNIHLITDILSIFIGYQYYKYLRDKKGDHLQSEKRHGVIIGAAAGAFLGSRLLAYLEHMNRITDFSLTTIFSNKTIVGGVIGGIIGVELAKVILKIKNSTGDLLTLPLILGIIIGRIGCFLTGVTDGTVGNVSAVPWAFDQGDGLMRHPTALYEILFLAICFFVLKVMLQKPRAEGAVFKIFVLLYLSFRFFVEFIKPREIVLFDLSYIQLVSGLVIACYAFLLLKIYYKRV